jgi:hypothetical protein
MQTQIDPNDPRFEFIQTADGRRARILRDGHAIVTKMHAMDSDVERAIAATKQTTSDVNLLRHRPGFRQADDDNSAARRKIYADADVAASNAWRGGEDPHGAGEHGQIGAREGDTCMINGRRGRLEMVNGRLICMSASPDPKGDAYSAYDAEISQAYLGDGRKFQAYDPQGREAGSWTEEDPDDEDEKKRRR